MATQLRRLPVICAFVWLTLGTPGLQAQITQLSGYTFTYSTSNALSDMSGSTTRISSGNDDYATGSWDIGFDFVFCGNSYRYFSVSSNGPLGLHTSSSSSVSNYIGAGLQSPPFYPFIAGGTGDLYTMGNGIRSKLFGTAPNRYLVVEWDVFKFYNTATTALWQVRLYEGSGAFELVYGNSASSGWASLRIGATNGSGNFASINTSNNTVSYTSETSSNNPAPVGTLYRFAPCQPTLAIAGDTNRGGTAKMANNDSVLYGKQVQRGSSATYYPFTLSMGSTPCGVRTYSLSISGPAAADYQLSPSTGSIGANGAVTPALIFAPQGLGVRNATLTVSDNGGLYMTYRLMGEGMPRIRWTGNSTQGGTTNMADGDTIMQSIGVNRGSVASFTPLTLTNFSTNTGSYASITYTLVDPTGEYSVAPTTTSIAGGQANSVVITFRPTGLGPQYARLVVNADNEIRTFILAANSKAPQLRFNAEGEDIATNSMLMFRSTTCVGEQVISVPILVTNFGLGDAIITDAKVFKVDTLSPLPIPQRPLVRDASGQLVVDPMYQFSSVPGVAPVDHSTDIVFPYTVPAGTARVIFLNYIGPIPSRPMGRVFIWSDAQNLITNLDTSGLPLVGVMNFMTGPRVVGATLAGTKDGKPVQALTFPNTKIGNVANGYVTIANSGLCDLRISKKDLRLFAGDVTEFKQLGTLTHSRIDGTTNDYVIAPNSVDTIFFSFSPLGRGGRRATFMLKTNDSTIYLAGLTERGMKYVDIFGEGTTDLVGKELYLGQVIVDDTITSTVEIKNPNLIPISIAQINITGTNAADFSADPARPWPPLAYELMSNGTLSLGIRFTPTGAPGRRDADMVLRNATGIVGLVHLRAEAGTREVTVTPTSLFDNVTVSAGKVVRRSVAITNTGTFPVVLQAPVLSGTDATNYRIGELPRRYLDAGTTEYLEVTFAPSASGPSSATLEIASNAGVSPATVTLGGTAASIRPGVDDDENSQPGPGAKQEDAERNAPSGFPADSRFDHISVSVSPNPAADVMGVVIGMPRAGRLAFSVVDARGEVVQTLGMRELPGGSSRLMIDAASLSAGVYALRVTGTGCDRTIRFVVAR